MAQFFWNFYWSTEFLLCTKTSIVCWLLQNCWQPKFIESWESVSEILERSESKLEPESEILERWELDILPPTPQPCYKLHESRIDWLNNAGKSQSLQNTRKCFYICEFGDKVQRTKPIVQYDLIFIKHFSFRFSENWLEIFWKPETIAAKRCIRTAYNEKCCSNLMRSCWS